MTQRKNDSALHLVLLPGLDGTGKLFAPFIKQFPDPTRMTVISYPMDKYIPFTQLVDYIIHLLPTDRPLALLGESYSGPVALSLASKADLDIRKVILVATFAKFPASFLKTVSKFLPLSLLFRLPIPDFAIRYYCFGSTTNKILGSLLRDSIKANKPEVLAKRVHDVSSVDVTGLLAGIKVPCLYIAASDDKLVPGNAINHLRRHLPDLSVVTIQGSHFILQVQPNTCFNVVNNFLL
jgi:pimeloyl-ACP methyl ester carboxylesterase